MLIRKNLAAGSRLALTLRNPSDPQGEGHPVAAWVVQSVSGAALWLWREGTPRTDPVIRILDGTFATLSPGCMVRWHAADRAVHIVCEPLLRLYTEAAPEAVAGWRSMDTAPLIEPGKAMSVGFYGLTTHNRVEEQVHRLPNDRRGRPVFGFATGAVRSVRLIAWQPHHPLPMPLADDAAIERLSSSAAGLGFI